MLFHVILVAGPSITGALFPAPDDSGRHGHQNAVRGWGLLVGFRGCATEHREDAGGLGMGCFTAWLVPFSLGGGWRGSMSIFPCPLVRLWGCWWLGAREGGSGDGGCGHARCQEAMLKVAEADAANVCT